METILEYLRDQAQRAPSTPAIFSRVADRWESVSWLQVWNRLNALSQEFVAKGLAPGDRLAIIAPNSLEWELTHYATLTARAIVIGLDAHDTSERLQKVLHHAAVNALVVADEAVLAKLGAFPESAKFVVVLSQLTESIGYTNTPAPQRALPRPDDPATLIYTSGTTGEPKGILYNHRQLVLACESVMEALPNARPRARFVCWLPMSNLFQRIMNLCAIASGASLYMIADPLKVLDFVREIKPDVFIGVPRFYEKLAMGIKAKLAAGHGVKAWIARQALAVGERYATATRNGARPGALLALRYRLADKLVLRQLRGLLGDRLQYLISGSAPTPRWILEYFHSFGWQVLEAYGLSENIIPVAMNTPDAYRFGSVGKVMCLNEVRVAEDGELMVKGPGLFDGYHRDSGSFERVSDNGFYRTGDFGQFDSDGFLTLTGRKSEIIKTSAGRRIALPRIESVIRELSWVDHAVVFGSGRKCLIALLTLGSCDTPNSIDEPRLRNELIEHIHRKLARHEQPAAALLLQNPFSVEGGELTPNLKLRRAEIERKHGAVIDNLFQRLEAVAEGDGLDPFVLEIHG